MPFDIGNSTGALNSPSDFSSDLCAYQKQVSDLSDIIKTKQSELKDIETKITVAEDQVRARYQNKMQPLEDQLEDLKKQINELTTTRDALISDTRDRQTRRDGIILDFCQKQKNLDNSWADFHRVSDALLNDQTKFKMDQDSFLKDQVKLASDKTAFGVYKDEAEANIAMISDTATNALSEATQTLTDAKIKMGVALAKEQEVMDRETGLNSRITEAQAILHQADVIEAQRVKNEEDQKVNSISALQNQNDANQIKVARIALNNQQQTISVREQAVVLAEQKLGG